MPRLCMHAKGALLAIARLALLLHLWLSCNLSCILALPQLLRYPVQHPKSVIVLLGMYIIAQHACVA